MNTIEKITDVIDFSVSDEDVIEKIISGNKNVFEVIMRRYNQRLFRIGHAYLKDEEEIEDVIQATYMKAYEQLPRFEKRSRFSTWLIRIFINEALFRLKLQNRYCSFYDEESYAGKIVYSPNSKDSSMENPYNMTINNELKEILEREVNALPEKYRVVFIMREIEDMSIAETSKSLKISESNVKVRLNRAKEMLRENLSMYYHYNDVFSFNLIRCNRIVFNVLSKISTYNIKDHQNEK